MTTALTTSPFSAAPSATGYLYQCRYALLLLLQRSRQDIDAQLALEKFDDISFESSGNPTDLIQTKHHIGAIASLIDTSTDLWKTLRVWSEAVRSGTAQPTSTVFTLITCAIAVPDSAASLLRSGTMRDPDRAHSILVSTANRMKGEGLKAARDAFLALSDDQRKQMLRATQIVDGASTITTVHDDIRREINWAVRETHLSAFQQRLEGWWFNEIIKRLSGAVSLPITGIELSRFMDDLRDSFKTDALPIDFLHATPGDIEATDDRTFVRQMRLIKVGDARIRWARIDFYRAYSQRSKWLSDNLLALQQLTDYDEILEEEWKRLRDRLAEMTVEGETPELAEKRGLTLFDHCYDNCRSIRPNCTERYVGRGSYHMLADQKTVGWHRDYMRLLDAKAAEGKS